MNSEPLQGGSGGGGGFAGDSSDGPLRHWVVGGEVLDCLVRADVDEEGIDLDELAWT